MWLCLTCPAFHIYLHEVMEGGILLPASTTGYSESSNAKCHGGNIKMTSMKSAFSEKLNTTQEAIKKRGI